LVGLSFFEVVEPLLRPDGLLDIFQGGQAYGVKMDSRYKRVKAKQESIYRGLARVEPRDRASLPGWMGNPELLPRKPPGMAVGEDHLDRWLREHREPEGPRSPLDNGAGELLTAGELDVARQEARRLGQRAARRVFNGQGNHDSVALTEVELSDLLDEAFEHGYGSAVLAGLKT
jgi:hypothetical protein